MHAKQSFVRFLLGSFLVMSSTFAVACQSGAASARPEAAKDAPKTPTLDPVTVGPKWITGKAATHSEISIEVNDAVKGKGRASDRGEFAIPVDGVNVGDKIVAVQKDTAGNETRSPEARVLKEEAKPLGELSRVIVGFEQAGASSSNSTQKFFFDLYLSVPLAFRHSSSKTDPYFGPRWRSWGDIRITSVPQQIHTSIGNFAANFAQQVANIPVNEVAQAAEFLAGLQCRIAQTENAKHFSSFDREATERFTLSVIAGGGVITPKTPRQTLEVFQVPTFDQSFLDRFPQAKGKDFIGFVLADRDRFFRQYYAGVRLETYYFDSTGQALTPRFPATLDVTYGFNESVTGGRIRSDNKKLQSVLRLEAFYPLPLSRLQFIYLFGTALLSPTRARISQPLILQPAPANTLVPAANAVIVTIPQINRDYYRIGIGIDFISAIKCWRGCP